jgi:hypothetical protein
LFERLTDVTPAGANAAIARRLTDPSAHRNRTPPRNSTGPTHHKRIEPLTRSPRPLVSPRHMLTTLGPATGVPGGRCARRDVAQPFSRVCCGRTAGAQRGAQVGTKPHGHAECVPS